MTFFSDRHPMVVIALCCGLLTGLPVMALAAGQADTDSVPKQPETGLGTAVNAAIEETAPEEPQEGGYERPTGPFLVSFTNTPKAGATADVRQNIYYGEIVSLMTMRNDASFTNTLSWSQEEYRKQNKNVEKRGEKFNYGFGKALPFIATLDGSWDWSEDKTVNTAGFANLYAQEKKRLSLRGTKTKTKYAGLTHSMRFGGSIDEKESVNQNTANNTSEATGDIGLQSGWEIRPGLVLAGRIYGTAGSGERTLAAKDSPSSSNGDTLGVGIYFDQSFSTGRVAISRANFQKKYLDFRKNSNGLIDTMGIAENLKVVDELETKDALQVEFESLFLLGPASLKATAGRTTDDWNYKSNGQGLKQRQQDQFQLASGVRVGADSLSVTYDFLWKWDDQRIQGATSNRGRQYNKHRELEFVWQRPLFEATKLRARYYQGLSQDIAEFQHNQNDKDRLQSDISFQLDRRWFQVFYARMVYTYRQTKDLAIRDTRSSNNNIKDTYEITPNYTWYMAPWLTWDQSYRVYIQYTDYVHSELESVSREDNYNKRGNLTTKVSVRPTDRLEVVLRHDYNKKFNATRSGADASGGALYSRDLNQTISKLDVGVVFKVIPGVVLEAATYRTRDDRVSFGRATSEKTEFSGEIWTGARVDKTWRQTITLSASVKKFNAFGPNVTETSADYWDADIWLKWGF